MAMPDFGIDLHGYEFTQVDADDIAQGATDEVGIRLVRGDDDDVVVPQHNLVVRQCELFSHRPDLRFKSHLHQLREQRIVESHKHGCPSRSAGIHHGLRAHTDT